MRVEKAGFAILNPSVLSEAAVHCERIGRVCYRSEDLITTTSADKFINGILKSGHETVIEHSSVSVRFICDRGISHELVRHRIASFSQESTRYVNYSKDKHGGGLAFIEPCMFSRGTPHWHEWCDTMEKIEESYLRMVKNGATPEQARTVLPCSVRTEIVMTANMREWRHFFRLRALGTTGRPHPQMLELAVPLLKAFADLAPPLFGDLASLLKPGT